MYNFIRPVVFLINEIEKFHYIINNFVCLKKHNNV